MLVKNVKYRDFNEKECEETLYFNLTEAEAVRLDMEFEGGLEAYVKSLTNEKPGDILRLFERLLRMSYGRKSDDGKHFFKSEEEAEQFAQSAAYAALFLELMRDTDKAVDFFSQVVTPRSLNIDMTPKAN
jgi:hypothetical protein